LRVYRKPDTDGHRSDRSSRKRFARADSPMT